MVPDVNDRVERFHEVLIDEILDKQPEYIHAAFKVAEIYQTLVPYRSHRDALGVEMNGDYEDTLLRLLAGAGDLLILESDSALEEIRKELDSTTPNTGRFRDFASADVRLNQAVLPEGVLTSVGSTSEASASPAESTMPTPLAVDADTSMSEKNGRIRSSESGLAEIVANESPDPPATTPPTKSLKFEPAPLAAPAPERPALGETAAQPTGSVDRVVATPQTTDSSQSSGAQMSNCQWCNAVMPDRANVHYCPYCGTSTSVKPCKSCGDEMELAWRYCVSCGTEAEEAANAA